MFDKPQSNEKSVEDKKKIKHWRIPEWFPELPEDQISKLRAYHLELLHFNVKMNLISLSTESQADLTHFADSIMASQVILHSTKMNTIYDLGSGNGFPGIILAILGPSKKVILVDKDARKVEFLKLLASRLGLDNVDSIHARLEDLEKESIECAVSRGFASMSKALLIARKQCKNNCEYYHLKSENWIKEVSEIPAQLCSHWAPKLVAEYSLPEGNVNRSVLVSIKIS